MWAEMERVIPVMKGNGGINDNDGAIHELGFHAVADDLQGER